MTQRDRRFESNNEILRREFLAIENGAQRTTVANPSFDRSLYEPATIERALVAWSGRLVVEHRSSTVFTQLALQLFDAGASVDCQVVMLRMAQDELRHAGTCRDVIAALGGNTAHVELTSAAAPLAQHAGCSLQQRALRNVIYTTCMSELVACGRFVAGLETMTDPYFRDVQRVLLADERLHGQFGFLYLDDQREWLASHPEECRALERFLEVAFATIEVELAPPKGSPKFSDDDNALGLEHPDVAHDVFYGTMLHAVIPGLEAFGVHAEEAWKKRKACRPSTT